MPAPSVLLALYVAALPDIETLGSARCPDAAAVSARLREIVPERGQAGAGRRAILERMPGALRISLQAQGGTALAERRIETPGSCADLVIAAAVVIAAWELNLSATGSAEPALPLPAAPMMRAGSESATMVARDRPAPVGPETPRWDVEAGVAALALGADTRWAPGAALMLQTKRSDGRWFLRTTLVGAAFRNEALGPADGHARWARLALHVGGGLRQTQGAWFLDLPIGLAGGRLAVAGESYASGRRDASYELGLFAGATIGRRWGRTVPFVELGTWFWPQQHRLVVTNDPRQALLPAVDVQLAVGVRLGGAP